MGLTVKAGSEGSFVPVPAGLHLARCYQIIDLGTQKSEYMGKTKYQPKVMFKFEVHGEDDQGNPLVTSKGEPMSISKNYTASLSDMATLREDLKNWRGRDFTPEELRAFELKNVLGAFAMISVSTAQGRDGKEYTNIGAIMPVPANIKKAGLPEGHNPTAFFDLDNPDMTLFETLSENIKNKIMSSPEWQERQGGVIGGISSPISQITKLDDDIPF
jgi:hypothetical protein